MNFRRWNRRCRPPVLLETLLTADVTSARNHYWAETHAAAVISAHVVNTIAALPDGHVEVHSILALPQLKDYGNLAIRALQIQLGAEYRNHLRLQNAFADHFLLGHTRAVPLGWADILRIDYLMTEVAYQELMDFNPTLEWQVIWRNTPSGLRFAWDYPVIDRCTELVRSKS